MNHCAFTGNLGRDPEVRDSASGKKVCTFSLAVDDRRGSGEALWLRIVTFDTLADQCSKRLQKGSQVAVSGRIANRAWQDPQGVKHMQLELITSEVEFIKNYKPVETQADTTTDTTTV